MKHLIAVAYPAEEWAGEVIAALHGTQGTREADLDDAVYFVTDSDGQVHLYRQDHGIIDRSGIWWGLVRMMVESLTGGVAALQALLREFGFDASFVNRFTAVLRPNWSTIVVFVRHTTGDKLLPELSEHGGIVFQTPIYEQIEANLSNLIAQSMIQTAMQAP